MLCFPSKRLLLHLFEPTASSVLSWLYFCMSVKTLEELWNLHVRMPLSLSICDWQGL